MIAIIILIVCPVLIPFLWILTSGIIYCLRYKYNNEGLALTYHLQARWELYGLETGLRVHQIKKREEIAQRLTPVEDAGYKQPDKGEILLDLTEETKPKFLVDGENVIYLDSIK